MSSDEAPSIGNVELETQFVPRSDDDEVLWEVQEITAERGKKYKVKWAGVNPETGKPWPQSWVAKHDCTNDLVIHWKTEKRRRAEEKRRRGRTGTMSRTSGSSKRAGSSTSGRLTRPTTSEVTVSRSGSPLLKWAGTKRKGRVETPTRASSPVRQVDELSDVPRPRKKLKMTAVERMLVPPLSEDEDGLGAPARRALREEVHADGPSDEEEDIPPPKAKAASARHSDGRSKDAVIRSRALDLREESRVRDKKAKLVVALRKERAAADDVQSASEDEESPQKKLSSDCARYSERSNGLSKEALVAAPFKVGPPPGKKRGQVSKDSGPSTKLGPSRTKSREVEPTDERVPVRKSKGRSSDEPSAFGEPLLLRQDLIDESTTGRSPLRMSIPPLPQNVRPHSPDLSPGALVRLELFDLMVTPFGAAPSPPEYVPDDTHCSFGDHYDVHDPRPLSPLLSKSRQKHLTSGTPNELIVPETESSRNSQSQPHPLTKLLPSPRPPAARESPRQPVDLPAIAVIDTFTVSLSPPSEDLFPLPLRHINRPSKRSAVKPVPQITPNTFRSVVKARVHMTDSEAPPSSIESFTSPKRVDKGKQKAVEVDEVATGPSQGKGDGSHRKRPVSDRIVDSRLKKELFRAAWEEEVESFTSPMKRIDKGKQEMVEVDELMTSSSEGEGNNRRKKRTAQGRMTDSGLKKRGQELFDQIQVARETEWQKKKKARRLRAVDDIVNQRVSSPPKGSPLGAVEEGMELQWEEVIDLTGGANSTTLDTAEQSVARPVGEEERERLRVELREEEEENTQEAMGICLPQPVKESRSTNGQDAQMPPPNLPKESTSSGQLEDVHHVEQPSAERSTDLQLASVMVQPSQEQQHEDMDVEPLSADRPTSSPPRPVPENLSDSPKRRLGEALSLLNVKSEEIQRLERALADECKNVQNLKAELAVIQQSSEPTGPVLAAWEAERAEWAKDRSKWEKDLTMWETQRKELTDDKASLETRVTELLGAIARAGEVKVESSELEVEHVAWTKERDALRSEVVQRSEELTVLTEAPNETDQDLLQWAAEKASWTEEKARWEVERAALQEKQEALTRSVDEFTTSVQSLTSAKASAENDRDFFREQYVQASGFVNTVREENQELEKRTKIAEGQARDGVAAIKTLYEGRINALQADVNRWKGTTELLHEKDRRTNDEVRLRAARAHELEELCGRLRTEKKSLQIVVRRLSLARQHSVAQRNRHFRELFALRKQRGSLKARLSKLTKPVAEGGTRKTLDSVPVPPVPQDPDSVDPNDVRTLPDLSFRSSDSSADELALFPCLWRPQWRDQCQHVFDAKEDLERHMQEHFRDPALLRNEDSRLDDEPPLQAPGTPEREGIRSHPTSVKKSLTAEARKRVQRKLEARHAFAFKNESELLNERMSKLAESTGEGGRQEASCSVPPSPLAGDPESTDPNDMPISSDPVSRLSDSAANKPPQ